MSGTKRPTAVLAAAALLTGALVAPATALTVPPADDAAASPSDPTLVPKVLVIGIDGGGQMDVIDAAGTPHLQALRDAGTWGTSLLPATSDTSEWPYRGAGTISGPGWSSILTGVWPDKHRVLDNTFAGKRYDLYPSVFDRVEEVAPEIETFAASTWSPLTTTVTAGGTILQADTRLAPGSDAATEAALVTALSTGDPDLAFVQLDDVDGAGHSYGSASPQFRAALETVDTRIGHVLDAIESRPTRAGESWTVVVTADHGHTPTGGHGGRTIAERSTFVVASGDAWPAERRDDLAITDIVPTALDHLGVPVDEAWGLDGVAVGARTPDELDALRPVLSPRVDETGVPADVLGWTATPPAGWTVENDAMPSGGVTEWRGWTFTTQEFWSRAESGQGRENALRMRDVFAVADSDEWDDKAHAAGRFDSTLTTPAYGVAGRPSLTVDLQSAYRHETGQTAEVRVSFDGGARTTVASLTGSQNGALRYVVDVPTGASTAQVHFRKTGANNWFWAIDDVRTDAPRADAPADVTVEATARCLAGTAYVAVRATNTTDAALDVTLSTAFGSKATASVRPGASAYQSFPVRASSVEAGEAVVTTAATSTVTATYTAATCR